jgi:hypothetical protein
MLYSEKNENEGVPFARRRRSAQWWWILEWSETEKTANARLICYAQPWPRPNAWKMKF